jgi:hypothetical protein
MLCERIRFEEAGSLFGDPLALSRGRSWQVYYEQYRGTNVVLLAPDAAT